MRLLRQEIYRRMPWKNGGGLTAEIALFPEGSGGEDFLWRLSLATVSASGPFSRFAGIDRSIACLSGGGMHLALGDGRTVTLRPGDEPFSFAGEEAIHADCLDGETLDLNVMTRRGRWRHAMRRVTLGERQRLAPGDAAAIVFAGAATILAKDDALEARPFDCLLTDGGAAPLVIAPDAPLDLFVITLDEV